MKLSGSARTYMKSMARPYSTQVTQSQVMERLQNGMRGLALCWLISARVKLKGVHGEKKKNHACVHHYYQCLCTYSQIHPSEKKMRNEHIKEQFNESVRKAVAEE